MNPQDHIDSYVDDELSPQERAAFEAAMHADPELRRSVEGTLRLKRDAGGLPDEIQPSTDLWPAIAGQLGGPRAARWPWLAGAAAGLVAVAAVLLVAVGLFAWGSGLLGPSEDARVADGSGWRLPWTRPPTDGAVAAGHAALREGDLPAATSAFEAAVAARPDDVEACIGLAYLRLLGGDHDGADALLAHALEVAPAADRPPLLLRRAIVAHRRGDLQSMQRHGEASGLPAGLVLAAELYLADAEADSAVPLLRRASEGDDPIVARTARAYLEDLADTETGRAQLAEATALWALSQYDEAVETAEELLAFMPIEDAERDADLLLWAGRAATRGRPGIAEGLLDEMGGAPDDQAWRVQATRALVAVANGDHDEALAVFDALQLGGAPAEGVRDARLTAASLADDEAAARRLLAGITGPEAALVAGDASLVGPGDTPLARYVRGW